MMKMKKQPEEKRQGEKQMESRIIAKDHPMDRKKLRLKAAKSKLRKSKK